MSIQPGTKSTQAESGKLIKVSGYFPGSSRLGMVQGQGELSPFFQLVEKLERGYNSQIVRLAEHGIISVSKK